MLLKFSTDEMIRAKAALLVYAMYRSRDKNSPLNGLETWNRVEQFCKGAALKSNTTSEFVTKFKEMSKIGAIKPKYLSSGESGMAMLASGAIVQSGDVKDYQIDIIEDNEIRVIIEKEYPLITMLVRDRIQTEKYEHEEEEENEED